MFEDNVETLPQTYNQFTKTEDINIESITLLQTGTYTTPVIRPYITNLTGDTIAGVQNAMANSYDSKLSPKQLAGKLGGFFSVSVQPEAAVNIPCGWGENRCRFILKARSNRRLGNDIIYYIQGYTDHLGVTPTGSVDPQMMFYINSYVAVEELVMASNAGSYVTERVVKNDSVLADYSNERGFDPNRQLFQQLRPNDIYSNMQINHLSSVGGSTVLDQRSSLMEPTKSTRSNNNPVDYFSRIINSYIDTSREYSGQLGNDAYQKNDQYISILDRSLDTEESSPLYENGFFKLLSKLYGTPSPVNHFNINILLTYDQNVGRKINWINTTGRLVSALPNQGQSEHWTVQTREVVAATVILNSLSAIMFDLLISKVRLVSTNMDVTGRMNTVIYDSRAISSADYSTNLQRLVHRFETEVMFELTFSNQDSYQVEIEIDLFGSSNVNIGFSGHPVVPFIQPTFADSCVTPVLTKNPNVKDNLVNDFETILNMVETEFVGDSNSATGNRGF